MSILLQAQVNGKEVIVLDAETHDLVEPRPTEVAYAYLDKQTMAIDGKRALFCQRYNPELPISYGAMATSHIIDEDVQHCPSWQTFALPSDVGYIVGHNIGFDMTAIGNPSAVRCIDTLSLARQAWPELSNHKQSTIMYFLGHCKGLLSQTRDMVVNAHKADIDIQMCAIILENLMPWASAYCRQIREHLSEPDLSVFDCLHLLSEATRVPMKLTFGKHEGMAPWLAPRNYISWFCDQPAADPYVALSMWRGGQTESGRALFALACDLFSDTPTPAYRPSNSQTVCADQQSINQTQPARRSMLDSLARRPK